MNLIELSTCKIGRKIYQKLIHKPTKHRLSEHKITLKGQQVSDYITQLLLNDQPCLIARFGEVELDAMLTHYFTQKNRCLQYKNFITGVSHRTNWDEHVLHPLNNNAGVFPKNKETAQRFATLCLSEIPHIDVLGSWLPYEIFLEKKLERALWVHLADLEPYYHTIPWSKALKNKNVLVIHPFEESIQNQYQKRLLLFKNQQTLPDFNLKTLKAIQSAAGVSPAGFKDWFEALEYMKYQVSSMEFDIALIGCGAYGFPLGAYIKRLGKKAIHLGGATQILFGIKGKRWDQHPFIANLYNEHWTRPLPSETPQQHQNVEDGCYW